MDAAMSATNKRSHNYVVDGVVQSNTNRALGQSAFIDITKEIPVNQQQLHQQQQQPYPRQQGFYPNQPQQNFYPPQQDIRAQMYGRQQFSYSQPNVGDGPNGLHTMSMTSQRTPFNGIPNGNSNSSRSNSLVSSASHMNSFLKKRFRRSGGGSSGIDDDEKEEKGTDFNLVDDTHISFDDLQHIRGGGRYGSSQVDTAPYIPTLSSKPKGPKGQLSNPQYRKQKMAERKLMAAQSSALPPNGPRAMSLQSSYQYGQGNPRTMSMQSAGGYSRDPRAMSMQGRPPFGNPTQVPVAYPQQQGPIGGANQMFHQGLIGSHMYQQGQMGSQSSNINTNGIPMKMNNRYSGPASVGQVKPPGSPQLNRNSPRMGQPQQQFYPGPNPQMGGLNNSRNFAPQPHLQSQGGPGGPGNGQGRYQQFQPIQETPDQQSQRSQHSRQSLENSSHGSGHPYQNQTGLNMPVPQQQLSDARLSVSSNNTKSAEQGNSQGPLGSASSLNSSEIQPQFQGDEGPQHNRMARKAPPSNSLQHSNSVSKRKLNRYVFNDSDNEDDDLPIREENILETQLADTVPTVSLTLSNARENEAKQVPLETVCLDKTYKDPSLSTISSEEVSNKYVDKVGGQNQYVASNNNERKLNNSSKSDLDDLNSVNKVVPSIPASTSCEDFNKGSKRNVDKTLSMYSATSSVDDIHYNNDSTKQVYQLAANGQSDVFLTANELLDPDQDINYEESSHLSDFQSIDATPKGHHPPTFYSSDQNQSEGTLKLGGASPVTPSLSKYNQIEAPPNLENNSRSFSFNDSFDDTYNSIGKTPENTLIQDSDDNKVTDSFSNVGKSRDNDPVVLATTNSDFESHQGTPSPQHSVYDINSSKSGKKNSVMDLVAQLNKKSSVEEFGKLIKQPSSDSFSSGYGKLRKTSTTGSLKKSINSNTQTDDQFSKSGNDTLADDNVGKLKNSSMNQSVLELGSNKAPSTKDEYNRLSSTTNNELEKVGTDDNEFVKSHKKTSTLESLASYKDTDSPLPHVPMKHFDPIPDPIFDTVSTKEVENTSRSDVTTGNGYLDIETLTSPRLVNDEFNEREANNERGNTQNDDLFMETDEKSKEITNDEPSHDLSADDSFDNKFHERELPTYTYESKPQPEIPEEKAISNPVFESDSSFNDTHDSSNYVNDSSLPRKLNNEKFRPVVKDTSDALSIPPLPNSKFNQSIHDSLTETMKQQKDNTMIPSLPSTNNFKSIYSGSPQLRNDGSSHEYQLNSAAATPEIYKGSFPTDKSEQRPYISSSALSPTNLMKISHASDNSVSSRRKPPPIDTSSPVVKEAGPGFSTPTAFTTPVNAPEPGFDKSFSSFGSDSKGPESGHFPKKSHLFGFNRSTSSQETADVIHDEESNGSMFNKLTKKNRSNSVASDPSTSPKLGKKKAAAGGFLKKLGIKNTYLNYPGRSDEVDSTSGNNVESTGSHGLFSSSGSTKRSNFFKPSNLTFKKKEDEAPPVPEKSLPVTPSSVDDALYNYRLTISLPNGESENDDVRFSKIVDMNQVIEEEPSNSKKSKDDSVPKLNSFPKKPSALGITTTQLKLNDDSNESFDFGASSPTGGRSSFAAGLSSALEEQVFHSRSGNISKEQVFDNPLIGTDKLTKDSISGPVVKDISNDDTPIVNDYARDANATPKVNQSSSSWSKDITTNTDTPKASFTRNISSIFNSDPFKNPKSSETQSQSIVQSSERSVSISTAKKYNAGTVDAVDTTIDAKNPTGKTLTEVDNSNYIERSSLNVYKDDNSITPVNNSRCTSQKAIASSPTLQRVFTPEQLGMLHANSQLLNELQIVSNELAESISREMKLEDHIRTKKLIQASVIDSSHRAGEISKLASELVNERKKRRTAEELLLRQSSGSGTGVEDNQLRELSYENSGLKNQITDMKDTLQLHRSTVDMLRIENDELKEKFDSLSASYKSLTNETIPELKNQLEILEFTASYEHPKEDYDILFKENEQLKKRLSESDDIIDLQEQKDSLREALKNLKQQRESEARVAGDKIKSLEAKIHKLTNSNSKF